jgi:nucleoside-diphosphate-sugar epimerase
MRILVTGASGFVGVNLVEALRARRHEVVEFSLEKGGDVADTNLLEKLMREERIEALWHGAAITAGAEREKREAGRILEVNTLATVRALEAAARAGVRRFVYPSSSAVYGATAFEGAGPVHEDEPLRPLTLYGISKVAAERAVLRLGPALGVEVAAGRINAVFGPGERDTGLRDTLSPHLQIAALAREGKEAVLARGAERDWIYAPDAADAFVRMLEASTLPPVAMNVTQGELWPLEIMAKALGLQWRYGETNLGYGGPIDRPRRPLCGQLLFEKLGWKPAHTPEQACAAYARWLATSAARTSGPATT